MSIKKVGKLEECKSSEENVWSMKKINQLCLTLLTSSAGEDCWEPLGQQGDWITQS